VSFTPAGDSIEVVGPEGAGRAPLLPTRVEHEVIDDQLASSVKELRQRFLAVWSFKDILLVDALPGQIASLLAEPVAQARKFPLLNQEAGAPGPDWSSPGERRRQENGEVFEKSLRKQAGLI
jgi:hypothetical protein